VGSWGIGDSGFRSKLQGYQKALLQLPYQVNLNNKYHGLELGKLSAIRDKARVEGILAVHTSPISRVMPAPPRRVPHCSAALFCELETQTVEHACTATARVLPQLVNYSTQSPALLLPSHNTRPATVAHPINHYTAITPPIKFAPQQHSALATAPAHRPIR